MKNLKSRNNALIINRILFWIVSFLAIPTFFTLSWYGISLSDNYIPSDNVNLEGWDAILEQIKYFTIWSNILTFIWITFALIAELTDNNKLRSVVEHPVVKTTPYMMMFITCAVSFTILYPYILGDPNISFVQVLEIAFLTDLLFLHFLVGIFFLIDMLITRGYKTKNNEKESQKTIFINLLYSSLVPLLWLIISLVLIGEKIIEPQYPFMDVFDTEGVTQIIYSIILTSIIFIWVGLWYAVAYLTNRKYKVKQN